jgi:hypothetical protein
MSNAIKISTLALVLILAVSGAFFITKPVSAQSISKPSVPEFTVQYSEDRTPNIMRFIVITIKDQPFTPTELSDDGNFTQLWYSVRSKLHSENLDPNLAQGPSAKVSASDANNTVVTIYVGDISPNLGKVLDFQVKAFVAHPVTIYDPDNPFSAFSGQVSISYESLSDSDWSQTQTITLTTSSSIATPTIAPNSTMSTAPPAVPKNVLEISAVVVLSIICLSFGLALRHQKKTKALQSLS